MAMAYHKMILFLLFNTFSVYFMSQVLQMSSLIASGDHSYVTPFSLIYDALYSILVVFCLHQLHSLTTNKLSVKKKAVYTIACHVGALTFGLMGEIPFLRHFYLTSGFWKRLPIEGKIVIGLIAITIGLLVLIQGRRAYRQQKMRRQWFPWVVVIIVWATLWSLVYDEHISYHVHVHHALFAGFFSCWFDDFTSWLDLVVNAVFIGIVIEGLDFYGIGELTLFMLSKYGEIDTVNICITWGVVVLGLIYSVSTKLTMDYTVSMKLVHVNPC